MDEISLRPAAEADLGFVSALARHPEVEPFLAPGVGEEDRVREFWREGAGEGPAGLYVIERTGAGTAGAMGLRMISPRSRLCEITRLMVDPSLRSRGIGLGAVRLACRLVFVEHDFHRVQAETYGDNAVGQRLFRAAGFTREGIRRRAYWRRDAWLDGVLYGLLAEEFEAQASS